MKIVTLQTDTGGHVANVKIDVSATPQAVSWEKRVYLLHDKGEAETTNAVFREVVVVAGVTAAD